MLMGKRNITIVLSSDDEEKDSLWDSSCRSNSKSKPRSSVRRTNPRGGKKARLSDSFSCLPNDSSNISLFPEDFNDLFSGFKVPAGARKSSRKELWVDKYKPRSLEELAVHKKKVEEVKAWFEERLRTSGEEFRNHVLLITGEAGVGKSATIQVIASHLGARVCEWNAPTPTIWQEYMHNSNAGVHYMSKLDEFESFVDRTRKYGLVQSSSFSGELKSSAILLIDDLPVTNGKTAYGRLHNCLHHLVTSTQIPTAILITDYKKTDSADNPARQIEELQSSLESTGACKVAFNLITVNSIKKTLSRICRQEQCNVTAEQIDLIAKASSGDIRHAISSLQYFCLKPDPIHSLSFPNCTTTDLKVRPNELGPLLDALSLSFGRDETLSLFHALGKFLHNKRESEYSIPSDKGAFLVREKFTRLPLKLDAPEKVLGQAHGQARPITDFLHENVLEFVSDEAVGDAWVVASYLSDADLLLGTSRGMVARNYVAENVTQSAAASVATRGVLFGNTYPLSSRWHAIRRPKLWQVEKSSSQNKNEMVRQKFSAYNGLSSHSLSVIATEYTPVLQWLGHRASGNLEEDVVTLDDDDDESKSSDDEIEDC